MDYKHILPKSKFKKIGLIIIVISMIFITIKFVEYQKYQMYIYMPVKSDHPEWPSKKEWFDAKQWLSQKHYIRSTDSEYLIDLNGVRFPLDTQYNKFIADLYSSMKWEYPTLAEQPLDEFYSHIKDTLKIEYLFSRFDREIKGPFIHEFIISFIYKEAYFETTMVWNSDSNDFSIYSFDFTSEKDENFKKIPWLTYRKYMQQKRGQEKR